ncbi:hypothetical protein KSNIM_19730, partial [Kitasatospora sp. DSM 101779]|nr:hypothetical protein [Kitasatospora sp. DSM 101779]
MSNEHASGSTGPQEEQLPSGEPRSVGPAPDTAAADGPPPVVESAPTLALSKLSEPAPAAPSYLDAPPPASPPAPSYLDAPPPAAPAGSGYVDAPPPVVAAAPGQPQPQPANPYAAPVAATDPYGTPAA